MYVSPYVHPGDNFLAMLADAMLVFTLLGTLGLQTSQLTASPLDESVDLQNRSKQAF